MDGIMPNKLAHPKSSLKTTLLILGLIPLLSGISGLVGWTTEQEFLTSLRPGLVPIAPTSAILFIALSLGYLMHLHGLKKPAYKAIAGGLGFLATVAGLGLFILSIFRIYPDFIFPGPENTTLYTGKDIGHMSPVSALLFIVLGVTFIIFRYLSKSTYSVVIPTVLSGFALLLSSVLFIGYLIGKPFFYEMNILPPAMNTTLSFLALSAAFTLESFFYERHKVSDAISAINDRFRNAFEHSAEGKSMVYPDGTYQVNQAFADMLGYSITELGSMSWKAITHPDDREMSQYIMDRMVQEHLETSRFEKRYIHKNGPIVWVDLQNYLQRDPMGNPMYFITSASDITATKAMQEQLIQAKELAERSDQLKDAFIANMSHEIRTPLNAILGFSDLIRDELEQSGSNEYHSYFDIIRSSSMRLMRTVDMIMNVSRLQVGAYDLHPVRLDLGKMINELVREYRLQATNKGLVIDFKNQITDSEITSDEYCTVHAISNLIDNAVKYTRAGNILLTLYRSENGPICLDVKDSGIGISDEFLTQIFNPFTQEEMSSTRKFEGIGLGLSIAYRMLGVTGSMLSVQSKKGKGTTFTVTFPGN
jgi:PAS domain S-box-containing protein